MVQARSHATIAPAISPTRRQGAIAVSRNVFSRCRDLRTMRCATSLIDVHRREHATGDQMRTCADMLNT